MSLRFIEAATTSCAIRHGKQSGQLSEVASKTLVQAFVFCRLDYCNSLFISEELQSVQSAAARLIRPTGTHVQTT